MYCVVVCYQNNEIAAKRGTREDTHGNLFVTDGQLQERGLKLTGARLRCRRSMQIQSIKRTCQMQSRDERSTDEVMRDCEKSRDGYDR